MKKFNPLVTIVIPVYNGSNYLREAINSALAQTYKNIEIIVVNDGSNDNGKTEKIALSYGDKIKYYKKENGGVATALNFALNKMKGEYFSWLSHDDLYYTNKIEKQIDFLQTCINKNAILYSDYDIIDKKSKIIAHAIKDHEQLKIKPEYSLLRGNINGITLLIPKKFFYECSFFDENLKCTQDYDLWLKFQKKYEFIHINYSLACTRVHSQQDTQINPKAIEEGNKLWIKMIESITDKRKIVLENSIYAFYNEMQKFLESTPYIEAKLYCKEKCEFIENNAKNQLKDTLVSVVIPFFNRENLTIRAIKSVLNQTFHNIEIILIDDCSSSILKLKKFIADKKNIIYYKNKHNCGPSFSRNEGITHAKGDFIAFLDSDDEFNKTKIEKQLFQMLLNQSCASYTNYIRITAESSNEINCYTEKNLFHNEYIDNCKIATPTVMLKKDFLINNKIFYNTYFQVCEDACFYLDILKYTDFLYIDDFLSKVYVNENSSINDSTKKIEGMKNLITYILNEQFYKNTCDNELEYLFLGYISLRKQKHISVIEEPITLKSRRCNFFRYLFRKFIPLNARQYLKKLINFD